MTERINEEKKIDDALKIEEKKQTEQKKIKESKNKELKQKMLEILVNSNSLNLAIRTISIKVKSEEEYDY